MSDALKNGGQVYLWNEKSKADAGERMIVLSWKQTKKMEEAGRVAHDKRFVSAPFLSAGEAGKYSAFVEASLGQFQKELIQEYVGEILENEKDRKAMPVVPKGFFNISSLLEMWEDSQGNTLSEDSVKAWFAEYGYDPLTLRFLERISEKSPSMDAEEAEKKAKQSAAQYGAVFLQLSGDKGIEKDNLKRMQTALEFMEEDTGAVGRRIKRRIERLLNSGAGATLEDL